MKNLLIGKNSFICRNISDKLINFDFISHNEINLINTNNYKYIYLFSWNNSLEIMEGIISKIPPKKIVFVSSVGVLSLNKRKQWNLYPVIKNKIEKLILDRSGYIMRFGILEKDQIKYSHNILPISPLSLIINALNQGPKEKITNVFHLRKTNYPFSFLKICHYITKIVPNIFIFRAPFEIIPKICGSKFYGYSADMLNFFHDEILIGYGVLGSAYLKQSKKIPTIIASNKRDYIKNDNGFVNLIVGYDKTGLSKYWHGAYVKKIKGDYYRKNPYFVKRNKLPFKTHLGHVKTIHYENNYFVLVTDSQNCYYSKKLVLGCGAIENTRLLCNLLKIKSNVEFSDHDIVNIGSVQTSEAIAHGHIKKFGIFIIKSKLFTDHNFLIEFRPHVGNRDSENFYNDTSKNIIIKIFKQFDFKRFNEAFFTKFGIGLYTKEAVLIAQVLNKNSIVFNPSNNEIHKKKLNEKILSSISSKIRTNFLTYREQKNKKLYDGQHITGGSSLYSTFNKSLFNKKIKILGSPSSYKLSFKHPTQFFIHKILNKIY